MKLNDLKKIIIPISEADLKILELEEESEKSLYHLILTKLDIQSIRTAAEFLEKTSIIVFSIKAPQSVQMTDEAVKTLADGLRENKSLKSFNIIYNNISKQGSLYITEALVNNHHLTGYTGLVTLNLGRGNSIHDISAIASFIRKSKALKEFSLQGTLDYENMEILLKGLAQNQSLIKLKLSHMKNLDYYMKTLTQFIEVSNSLEELDLSCNKLNSPSIVTLANALIINPVLTTLKLNSNRIGYYDDNYEDNTFKYVVKQFGALIESLSHESLDLNTKNTNYIENHYVIKLAALMKIPRLTSLDLNTNYMNNQDAILLQRALKENPTITFFDIRNNNIKSKFYDPFEKYIERNRDILKNAIEKEDISQLSINGRMSLLGHWNFYDPQKLFSHPVLPKSFKEYSDYEKMKLLDKLNKDFFQHYKAKNLEKLLAKQVSFSKLIPELYGEIANYLSLNDLININKAFAGFYFAGSINKVSMETAEGITIFERLIEDAGLSEYSSNIAKNIGSLIYKKPQIVIDKVLSILKDKDRIQQDPTQFVKLLKYEVDNHIPSMTNIEFCQKISLISANTVETWPAIKYIDQSVTNLNLLPELSDKFLISLHFVFSSIASPGLQGNTINKLGMAAIKTSLFGIKQYSVNSDYNLISKLGIQTVSIGYEYFILKYDAYELVPSILIAALQIAQEYTFNQEREKNFLEKITPNIIATGAVLMTINPYNIDNMLTVTHKVLQGISLFASTHAISTIVLDYADHAINTGTENIVNLMENIYSLSGYIYGDNYEMS